MAMSEEQDARALACCGVIHEELRRRLPVEERIFVGPLLMDCHDPAVARLRERGAHFFWVALPLGFGVAFWDAHAGVVVDAPTLTGTVGVHFRRGPADAERLMSRCAPALDAHRLRHVISEATDEAQWNAAPRDVSAQAGVDAACAELEALVRLARQAAQE